VVYLPKNFVKIQTENLLFVDITPSDWDLTQSFFDLNQSVLKYSAWQDVYKSETMAFFFDNLMRSQFDIPRHTFVLKIADKTDLKKIIGLCSLCLLDNKEKMFNPPEQTGIIRFFLSKEAQGFFYSLEVLSALLRLGFEYLNLHKINTYVDYRNKPLMMILARANMRKEGICRDYLYYDHRWVDQYLYSMLKKEWLESKK